MAIHGISCMLSSVELRAVSKSPFAHHQHEVSLPQHPVYLLVFHRRTPRGKSLEEAHRPFRLSATQGLCWM
jgi:hypothetical protein